MGVLFGIESHVYEFVLAKSLDKYKIWKDMHWMFTVGMSLVKLHFLFYNF